MAPDVIEIRIARPGEEYLAQAVYKKMGYTAPIEDAAELVLALNGQHPVGAARITAVNGALVLRGMFVDAKWQRQGIGKRMLKRLSTIIGERECFCLPYSRLAKFYGDIGFCKIDPAELPEFLLERYKRYRIKKMDVIATRRTAGYLDAGTHAGATLEQ